VLAAAVLLLLSTFPAAAQQPSPPEDDEALRARIAEAGSAETHPGEHLVTVLRWTDVEVEPSGLSHVRERTVVKCLDEQGAARLSRLRLDYDPASNTIQLVGARILRRDGSVEELSPKDAVDLPQPQRAIYWGPRMKLLGVPRLAPGDALETRTYRKGFQIAYLDDVAEEGPGGSTAAGDERYVPPMRGHFYDVVTFEEPHPVELRYYEVRLPRDKPLQYEVYHGPVGSYVTFDDEWLTYSFWKSDLDPFRHEPSSVAFSDATPKVVMATVQDWEAKSRWFAEVNVDQFQANEAIREQVQQLIAGAETDREKIAAITHWVANNIRYSGVSMGEGEGYTLHPGPMVWRNRAGVCKDKAGMAITMLRVAGFDVWPAMTMAGSRVERIPADQFNHCVAAVRQQDGEFLMVDPTWVPFSRELWSSAEGEQDYLVGTLEGEPLERMPSFDPHDHRLTVVSEAELRADGSLAGTLTVTGHGYSDQRVRRQLLHSLGSADRQAWFEEMVARLGPGARVEPVDAATERILDLSQPLSLEIRYEVPAFAVVGEDGMYFHPPTARHLITSGALAPYLRLDSPAERQHPILTWAPRMRVARETLKLPEGFRVAHLPGDRAIEGEAALLNTHAEVSEGVLSYEYTLAIREREIPVEHQETLRRVVREAKTLHEDPVVLERR
jgi:transglutaminase-like putative cysteine protease